MAEEKPVVRVEGLRILLLWAIGLAVVFYLFSAFQLVFLGVLASAALAAALRPVIRKLPGGRWVRAATAMATTVVVFVGVLGVLGYLVADPIRRQIERLPEYEERINRLLDNVTDQLGIEQTPTVREAIMNFGSLLSLPDVFSVTTTVVAGVLLVLAIIIFGSVYLLGEKPGRLSEPLLYALPPHRRQPVRDAVDDLDFKLRWWVLGTLIDMAVVGVASGLGYWLVGIDLALALGILAGVSEIVPTIGPFLAFLVALLVGAAEGGTQALGVVGVYAFVQMLESNLLVPYVMKRALHIPPVVTLFSVLVWAQVFGFAGLLLAIPINVALWSFFDHLVLRPRGWDPSTSEGKDRESPVPPAGEPSPA